jgi:regulator of protease activity HflC (stomatin/prohibitin superfamily)
MKAADIYRTVGSDYIGTIVEPQFRSAIREITASYEAKALYSAEREKIATEIFSLFRRLASERGIVVQQVLLRKIGLAPVVANAIQEKLRREQGGGADEVRAAESAPAPALESGRRGSVHRRVEVRTSLVSNSLQARRRGG